MRYSAAEQTNWMPRVFGPMMLRPGLQYITGTYNNAKVKSIPFIRATNDAQILEASNGLLRPLINDAPITRPSVSTAITNPGFTGGITGWTTADQAGASSAGVSNQLSLTGTGTNDAITYQAVTVASYDEAKEHGIRIVVNFGPVGLRIGTALGLDDLQEETQLGQGTHSLAITPNAATFYIYFFNRQGRAALVDSCDIEAAGVVTLPANWTATDLPLLRWCQSADVMFICDGSHQQQKIERRSDHSWSVVLYEPEDGPYRAINFSPTTLTPSGISGDITITASAPTFNSGHVGALFRLASVGVTYQGSLGVLGAAVGPLLITGTGSNRILTYSITNTTYSGTLKLQKSTSSGGPWTDVTEVFPGNGQEYNDGLDNQILYYQIAFTAYTSGSVIASLQTLSGSINGDVRIIGYTDNEHVTARVLSPLGGTAPTNIWYEGAWSDFRSWPTAVELYEDRLWWFGLGQFWGSITDSFESFDDTVEGDSGTINRTIGKGPVDWVNWGIGLLRLIVGTDGTLASARSDSLDTPLTPTNFNIKFPVTQGAARIAPCHSDDVAYFVHRNLVRVYELAFDTSNYIKLDYGASDLTALCPELCAGDSGTAGITVMAVQRQPDTRIHCVLSDGTVAVMVADKVENVVAWIKVEIGGGGIVEDAIVLPQAGYEDAVYYVVKRTINGSTVRYYEKFALESDCVGGTLNKQADSFVIYSGPAANKLTAIAPHLVGQEVVVWADGKDLSPGPYVTNPNTNPPTMSAQTTYTVASDGSVTLASGVSVSNAVIGLPYQAKFQGVKMAYGAQLGSALTMRKTISRLGLLAADMHSDGLRYGPNYNEMDQLPKVEGSDVPYDTIWAAYDKLGFTFDDVFGSDSRLCLMAYAPRPVRVLGLIPHVDTEE